MISKLKEFWQKFRPPQQVEKPSPRELGILGEKLARDYLRKRGYHILETNFRCPLGEIDIVARHKDALAFIEVRTRSTRDFGTPEESVTKAKQRKLSRLAEFYLKRHPELSSLPPRIDVVAVEMEGRKVRRIDLIQDALA